MVSVYVMISVPSADHERSLWVKKRLDSENERKLKPSSLTWSNKSVDDKQNAHLSNWNTSIIRSYSQDSVVPEKTEDALDVKNRALSAHHVPNSSLRTPMEERLEKCLNQLNIPNAVWVLGKAGKFYQVSFCTPAGEQCEEIIQLLTENEIGVEHNSTVSILPCTLYYEGKEHVMSPTKNTTPNIPPSSNMYQQSVRELSAWERFVHSVRARLMVAQVLSGVKDNATFTFDFLILLVIAAMTAAVGLVENSVVILVASMLISPLMGPVMASTFGFVTRDWKLQNIGVLSELLGLLLCVLIGFLYGLCIAYLRWESPDINWPTPEMLTRGDLRSLGVGALTALLAGAAVAIAVLGNYSCSLTGVAISASLMPPAVNAGLLWALAVITKAVGDTNPKNLSSLNSEDPVKDLMVLGALSLALTFINIVCIFLTGIFVLKIKEVTPRTTKDYSRLICKDTFPFPPQDCDCKMSTPAPETLEKAGRPSQFPNTPFPQSILNQMPYRFGLNQYTWCTNSCMSRPTVQNLASVWQQLNTQATPRPRCNTAQGLGERTKPLRQAARLWSEGSEHKSTSPDNILDKAFVEWTPPTSNHPESDRFTIVPTSNKF